AGGQSLEPHFLLRLRDPAVQVFVVREEFEYGLVGRGDVRRVARERRPAEWALALREERADVGGHETGEVERTLTPAELCFCADRVAVVEHLGTGVLEP